LLTTARIEIPLDNAKAAVSGSLFMFGSEGGGIILSFEGDVPGLMDSALNDGNGGKNCIPAKRDSDSSDPFAVNVSGVTGSGLTIITS
jgi:hypothetical protein